MHRRNSFAVCETIRQGIRPRFYFGGVVTDVVVTASMAEMLAPHRR